MRVHDLGQLELGGSAVRRPLGRRPGIVLGSLVAAGAPVEVAELADRAWPGLPVERQRTNLQTVVSRLRAELRDPGTDADPLLWTEAGYRLELSDASVDSTLFQALRTDLDLADDDGRLSISDRALQLFRGPFLGELGRESWADARRRELELIRREVLDVRWQTMTSRGRWADVIAETDSYQLDDLEWAGGESWEHARRHRMQALLQGGRAADALAEYTRIEGELRDHARRAPGPAVDQLRTAALQLAASSPAADRRRSAALAGTAAGHAKEQEGGQTGRPFGAVGPDQGAEAPRTPGRPVTALPPLLTRMVGRDDDLARLETVLQDPEVRLVSLLGPGGVGKTTLALQLARSVPVRLHHPDGVVWVGLSRARSRDQLLTLIAAALNFDPHGVDVVHRLAQYIASRRMLLILDNLEQLTDHAEVLTELLDRCPGLAVLSTSRRALDVRGELRFWVPTLPVPEPSLRDRLEDVSQSPAVAVLVRRARETAPGFRLSSANAGTVAEICVQLDGLPLALELAASRLDLFSPEDLLSRLSTDLAVIGGGARDLPERQRTLRDTLDWSYRLLSPEEQADFRRLAVFQGGFDYPAAERVLADQERDGDVAAEALQALMSQSLVRRIESPGSVRFALLETVRQFAARQLSPTERQVALDRHLGFYLELAERLAPELAGPARREALARLESERDNLRAALRHALERRDDPRLALRLVNALGWLWYFRGPLAEGREWCRRALDQVQPAEPGTVEAGTVEAGTVEPGTVEPGPVGAERAGALWNAGRLAHLQGATGRATSLLESSVALWRSLPGGQNGLAYALSDLGQVRWIAGERQAGRRLAEESVALFRRTEDRWGLALALQDLGQDVLSSQDLTAATALYAEIAVIFDDLDDRWGRGLPLLGRGRVAMAAGRVEESRRYLTEAHAIFAEVGDRRLLAFALMRLGQLERGAGDTTAATRWYRGALAAWRELDHEVGVAHALAGLAGSAAAAGQAEHAALLAGAAAGVLERQNRQLSPLDLADYAPYLAMAESALGPARFVSATDRGRRLSRAEVLTLATDTSPTGSAPASRTVRNGSAAGDGVALRPALTDREREIVRLVQQGLSYEQIAATLFITRRTVGFHLGRVYQKFQVGNRRELISLLLAEPALLT